MISKHQSKTAQCSSPILSFQRDGVVYMIISHTLSGRGGYEIIIQLFFAGSCPAQGDIVIVL